MPSNIKPMKGIFNYLINISLKDVDLVDDAQVLENYIIEIARELNFSVLGKLSHKFTPIGVTSILLLKESHISIHTWPEYGLGCIDVLTCSGKLEIPRLEYAVFNENLKIEVEKITEIERNKG